MENCAIEDRVVRYWTIRSHDFGAVRKNELGSIMGRRWQEELEARLPERSPLNILDVGTGTGFFAILMAQLGHKVTGIDLTPAMLEEAAAMAAGLGLDIAFRHMDAQQLDFPDGTFDVVLSRNLTWTLPEPEKAYAQWHRVLKPGGLLLNFDADYAANVRSESTQNCSVAPDSPYGHVGMTEALVEENNAITLALDVGQKRPAWDEAVLKKVGFSHCRTDLTVGRRVLGAADLIHAPMFGVFAQNDFKRRGAFRFRGVISLFSVIIYRFTTPGGASAVPFPVLVYGYTNTRSQNSPSLFSQPDGGRRISYEPVCYL